ncbi:MAG: type II toxin-antitoxin system VapC family toxin [Nocardioides sp.]
MKLPDLNLLLYAVNRESAHHRPAHAWWQDLLSSGEPVAQSWSVLLGFVRLSTRAQVFRSPLTCEQALDLVDGWLARPAVRILTPGPRHTAVLRDLLFPLGTAGNLTTDAHLAALAIEHGAELCSADTDFARFSGLRWINPLAG